MAVHPERLVLVCRGIQVLHLAHGVCRPLVDPVGKAIAPDVVPHASLSVEGGDSMTAKSIYVNRAPVLTLWASVVAQRLGFDEDEALTLGKAVAGLNARSKGRRLGIFKPHEQKPTNARKKERGEEVWIEVCGRPVPAKNTDDGLRAVKGTQVVDPDEVRHYLEGKFGENLKVVRSAMQKLAKSFKPRELAANGYGLYEQFRPSIPEGVKGWGAKGDLDLGLIERLAKEKP
jgi:hypothetical protein